MASAHSCASTVARLSPIVRDIAPGLPVRIAFAASPARQLALAGLDAVGVAARVRALHETEAIAG